MFKNLITILILLLIMGCGSKKQTVYQPKLVKKVVVVPKKVEQPIIVQSKTEPTKEIVKTGQSEVLEATSKVKVTNDMVLAYIAKYKEIAKSNMQQYGIPASITLSQALLESGSGMGSLCLQANNHFGIKCRADWTGPSVKYDDDALQECFRKYNDPKDSFKDHSAFLLSKPWYAKLFKLDKKDYKAWANGLKKAGYATDVKYPQKLITLIEKYKLHEIDNEVIPNPIVIIEDEPEILTAISEPKSETIAAENQGLETQNYYIVLPKDTMYSISKKFNISIDSIKTLNNMVDNALSIGQQLKIK